MLNHPPCARESSEGRTSQISHAYTDQHLWTLNRSPQPWNRKKKTVLHYWTAFPVVVSTRISALYLLIEIWVPRATSFTSTVLDKIIPVLMILCCNSLYPPVAFPLVPLTCHPQQHFSGRRSRHPPLPPPTRNNRVARWTDTPGCWGWAFSCVLGKKQVSLCALVTPGQDWWESFPTFFLFLFLCKSHMLSHLLLSVLRINLQHLCMAQC